MNKKELEYTLDIEYSRYLHQSSINHCRRVLAGQESREGLWIRDWQKTLRWHLDQLKELNNAARVVR